MEIAVRDDDTVPLWRRDLDIDLDCPLGNGNCRVRLSEMSMDPLLVEVGVKSSSRTRGDSKDGMGEISTSSLSTGHIPSINLRASPSMTAGNSPAGTKSVLLPTMTQQKSATSSSFNGARSLNSCHHFVSVSRVLGSLTSYINITASAPRKNAEERLENLSWPAVSYWHNAHR